VSSRTDFYLQFGLVFYFQFLGLHSFATEKWVQRKSLWMRNMTQVLADEQFLFQFKRYHFWLFVLHLLVCFNLGHSIGSGLFQRLVTNLNCLLSFFISRSFSFLINNIVSPSFCQFWFCLVVDSSDRNFQIYFFVIVDMLWTLETIITSDEVFFFFMYFILLFQ